MSAKRPRSGRRGAALACAVLVIASINLAIISAVTGGGDDARLAAQRAQTIRAFLAAESGVGVVIAELNALREPPAGPLVLPGGEEVEFTVSGDTPPIDITVQGRSGAARRSLSVRIE